MSNGMTNAGLFEFFEDSHLLICGGDGKIGLKPFQRFEYKSLLGQKGTANTAGRIWGKGGTCTRRFIEVSAAKSHY